MNEKTSTRLQTLKIMSWTSIACETDGFRTFCDLFQRYGKWLPWSASQIFSDKLVFINFLVYFFKTGAIFSWNKLFLKNCVIRCNLRALGEIIPSHNIRWPSVSRASVHPLNHTCTVPSMSKGKKSSFFLQELFPFSVTF